MSNNQIVQNSMMKKLKEEEEYFKSLPAGYRFKPRDEELVNYYLRRKILGLPLPPNKIIEFNLYSVDPETLTAMNKNVWSNEEEKEWYYFTPRDRKYTNGLRPARKAGDGYWKATGADKDVTHKGKKIGSKKTLVFYEGKPPKGSKTNWTMHEYVLSDAPVRVRHGKEDMKLDDCVLCRIYKNPREAKQRQKTPEEGNKDEADRGAIVPHEMAAPVSQPQPINMVAPTARDQYEQLEVQPFNMKIRQDTRWVPHQMAAHVSEPINMVAPAVYDQYEQLEVQPFNMNIRQDTGWLPEQDNPMPVVNVYGNYYMFDNDPTHGGGFQQVPDYGDFVTNAAAAAAAPPAPFPLSSVFPLDNQFQSLGNAGFNLPPPPPSPPLQFQTQLSAPPPPPPSSPSPPPPLPQFSGDNTDFDFSDVENYLLDSVFDMPPSPEFF